MARFVIDECVTFRLAAELQALGHDVEVVGRDLPSATSDIDILAYAVAHSAAIITEDRDFHTLIFRRGLPHTGVILLRLAHADIAHVAPVVVRVLAIHANDLTRFLTVTEHDVRIDR